MCASCFISENKNPNYDVLKINSADSHKLISLQSKSF